MPKDSKPERDPGMEPVERPKNYRPKIPPRVKFEVLIRQQGRCTCGCGEKLDGIDTTDFDHEPALVNRDWDKWEGDTIPPANDPNYLFAKKRVHHQQKTPKDIKERDKGRRVIAANAAHRTKMAVKTGVNSDAAQTQPFRYPSGSGSRGHFTPDPLTDKDDAAPREVAAPSAPSKFTRSAWPQGRKMATNKDNPVYRGVDGKLKTRNPKPSAVHKNETTHD